MTKQPPIRVGASSFVDRFCQSTSCSTEEFEQRVFWICIHPKGRRLAKVVWTADRAVFEDDFALIRALAKTSTYEEFKAEMITMRRERPTRGFIRDTLHVRLSGRALLTVASKLFGEYFRTDDETDPSMDTSFITPPRVSESEQAA